MDEMVTIVAATVGVCLGAALLGGVALRLLRMRALAWSIVVAALIPLLAVSASVLVNVRLMFISTHDSSAVSVALMCATAIGVLLSLVLGRRVAVGARRLTVALHDLGVSPTDVRPHGDVAASARAAPPASAPVADAPGEIAALATELEATRTRLAHAQQRALDLEESRRELVSHLSHDLRTPLTGLRALAEGLEDGVIEDQPTALRQLRQSVERMSGLVGDLFELSRVQAGSAVPTRRSMVSMVEITHDVLAELDAYARQRRVDLSVRLPADGDRLAVRGNADELARGVMNLAANAVRHTGQRGRVVVAASRKVDGHVAVEVSDQCGGIAASDLPKLFDVGWRGDQSRVPTADPPGSGLGLAITKGIVQAHHGTIGVTNTAEGCRFQVLLPSSAAR